MLFALIKSLVLFSLTLNILIFAEPTNDLISEICRKTRDPRLCSQVLQSDRRAREASSLVELGEVSMDLSRSTAGTTKNAITRLRLLTRDELQKQRYKSCATCYANAIYYLKIANDYRKTRDFTNVATYTVAALNEPVHCRDNFRNAASAEPAGLRQGNDKLECLCSVVLIISNKLSGRH